LPSTTTMPHQADRTGPDGPTAPSRTDHDPTAAIAALYPRSADAAQAVLAATAADLMAEAGLVASVGEYGGHATAEAATTRGHLVLVPMADLDALDAEIALEDDSDPAVWHVMGRDASGTLLEPDLRGAGCPSVMWAVRAGVDPAAAVDLVAAALADPLVAALVGRAR
jgi:hypothetical protein